jgi:hypothetical protein
MQPGYPMEPGYGGEQPGFYYPGPPPPPAGGANVSLAIVLSVVGALVGGFVYAMLLNAVFDDTDGFTAVGWASVLVGIAAGLGPGLKGGRSWGVYSAGAMLAFVGVVLGDLYGLAVVFGDMGSEYGQPDATEIFFENFGDLWDTWTEISEPVDYLLLLFAPAAALSLGGYFHAKQGAAQLPPMMQ